MDNLIYWNKVSTPPPNMLKTIKAGRLKGMSDIKPQWRYHIMTEVFGPCGIGWKYTVTNKWTENGSDNQIFAFADIELYFLHAGVWSEPIPGHGGSMLVAKESKGPHSSDEAFKMAITDALSTAMKLIGVASDIYMGNWDGTKYINKPPAPQKEITIGEENVAWLVGFCKRNKIIDPSTKKEFQSHYQFNPYVTTEKEFGEIRKQIESEYNEA